MLSDERKPAGAVHKGVFGHGRKKNQHLFLVQSQFIGLKWLTCVTYFLEVYEYPQKFGVYNLADDDSLFFGNFNEVATEEALKV